jgi:hypothetical protein
VGEAGKGESVRFWGANERRPRQRWWTGGRRGRAPRSACTRLRLEQLEDRLVPSTLTVLNLNDSGAGSLRAAVAAAAAGDAIDFAVTGVITLTSGRPRSHPDASDRPPELGRGRVAAAVCVPAAGQGRPHAGHH